MKGRLRGMMSSCWARDPRGGAGTDARGGGGARAVRRHGASQPAHAALQGHTSATAAKRALLQSHGNTKKFLIKFKNIDLEHEFFK